MRAEVLEQPADERDQSATAPERQPWFPTTVLAILEAPDEVEVLSVDPSSLDDEAEEIPTGPGLLHGYRIRGAARIPTAERRRAVGQALVAANRAGTGWAMCFDPHYAVRVSRGDQSAAFLICFWCGNVRVVGPGSHAVTYPFGKVGGAAAPAGTASRWCGMALVLASVAPVVARKAAEPGAAPDREICVVSRPGRDVRGR